MQHSIKVTDLKAPHVVYENAIGEIVFAQESYNYHLGLNVIKICQNFKKAAKLCKKLTKPTPPCK